MTKTRKDTRRTRRIDRARLLDVLLKGTAVTSYTARDLASKAHWQWDRERYVEAFVLFDAAAARADEDHDAVRGTASRNRAAVTLAQSGANPTGAARRLRAVLEHYREHPDDLEDRHWVEWAWTWLLELLAADDPDVFTRRYRAAVADCAALGCSEFPHILPHIERLAELARRAGARSICAQLVDKRRARKRVSKKLRARLAVLDAWSRPRT